jgi:site-specific DNA recombinase
MTHHDLRAALYARVSGDQQAKEGTIASQLEAVRRRVASDALECEPELCFVDDGYSGDTLIRPGLERLRDQASAGAIDRLYVLDPDRFSRRYAYQVLILEELTRCGVEVIFLCNPPGRGPEENLLRQVQGMIAEYERAKILERCRRGKQYAARHGSVNVLSGAPYGYRYVGKHEGGGAARYQVVAEEARVVRKIFEWIGQERCSIGEVCRRLQHDGVPTRSGKSAWDRSVIWSYLKNPAYKGTAGFGKTRAGDLKPQRLRPQRGRPEQPRRPVSRVDTSSEEQIFIEVPALVSEQLFASVQAQLEENRRRRRERPRGGRYLLQGLVVCKRCGYGCYGKPTSRAAAKGRVSYAYYRCTGSDAYRFGGQRLCWNKQVRTDVLDAAVWDDVRRLLSEPERIRAEYQRRLQRPETEADREAKHLSNMTRNVKKTISRLIDAYGEGLLDKSEFEPRILAARERLAKLEDEGRQRVDEAAREEELRLVIGQLEEFARRVSHELQEPDWATRREIVRALVKQVEIDDQEVRVVYRVSPSPFERGPRQGSSQRCWGRDFTPAVQRVPALRAGRLVRAGREATSPRAGLPRPLRGRLRDGPPRPTRRPTCAGRPAEAIRQVRPDRSPDQDEARAVLPAALPGQGAERTGSPSSWDLRPAGIHPLLGPIPARLLGDQTEDRREPLQPGGAEHRPVVSGQPAHRDRCRYRSGRVPLFRRPGYQTEMGAFRPDGSHRRWLGSRMERS